MRIGRRRLSSLLLAGVAWVLLGGCVVQRFAEFQRQLSAFDQNFQTDYTDGLRVHALHPLLESDDLHWLGLRPTLRSSAGERESWTVRWVSESRKVTTEPIPAPIEIRLDLSGDRLETISLPAAFWSPEIQVFFAGLIHHVTATQVDKLHRRVTATVTFPAAENVPLSRLAAFEKILGPPTETRNRADAHQYSYRFVSKSIHGVVNRVELTFKFGDDSFLREFRVKLPAGTLIFLFKNVSVS